MRILVAGIGNVYRGDDGFGVEVAHRLLRRPQPAGVRVADFGIRGFELACALHGTDVAILVDAYPHGAAPGALTVIEPDVAADPGDDDVDASESASHGLDPVSVLRLAESMHARPRRVLLVACQPATLGGGDGRIGLSPPVGAAVDEAVTLVESLAAAGGVRA